MDPPGVFVTVFAKIMVFRYIVVIELHANPYGRRGNEKTKHLVHFLDGLAFDDDLQRWLAGSGPSLHR